MGLVREWGCGTVLDYGCGQGALGGLLRGRGLTVFDYDPGTGKDERRVSDLVVCVDVLEHVEPEYLDAVLDDLRVLGSKGVYLAIGTKPADKKLPDGRNAHLIVEPREWWLEKLDKRWSRVFTRELPRFEAVRLPSIDFEYIGAV